ncbi:MAG: tetratricopeptide repeat protein [Candidatus Eisenbacteria bacterium]|nr:tetratricopeptide repeat protein [Candidatus Eisenbacteria bacterium]
MSARREPMKPGASSPRSSFERLWLLLLLLALVAYAPAMGGGWVWDDDAYILNNPALRSLSGLFEIWTRPDASPQYYPLVFTGFWIEQHLFGLDPRGYHVVNVLLHLLGATLLLRILRALSVPGALMLAALFALHPVHVESVAWVTERKNVLSAVFYFASALAFFRFQRPGAPDDRPAGTSNASSAAAGSMRDWRWYALALGLFQCALFSKTVTATLPAAVALALLYRPPTPDPRSWLRRVGLPLLPFFALGGGFGLLTAWLEKYRVGALGAEWDFSLLERFVIAGRVFWFYPSKLMAPWPLSFIYPRWNIEATPIALLPALLALFAIGAGFALRRRLGYGPLVAALFYPVTLFPALGFLNVYPMRFSFVADHFQYLASIGPLALLVGLWFRLRPARSWDLPTAITICLLLAGLTFRQSGIYRNAETLWRDTLSKNPSAWIARNNLGQLLLEIGRLVEAEQHFRSAIAIHPQFAEAHNNLATIHGQAGRLEEAIRSCDAAIGLDPNFARAYFNRALARMRLQQFDAALLDLSQFERLAGPYARASFYRGMAFAALGREEAAVDAFEASLRLDPNQPDVRAAWAKLEQRRSSGVSGSGERALQER